MEEFLNKYDINICFETIYNWKGKILDIEDLNEIVYNKETSFLNYFSKSNQISGLNLLVHQAAPCFELWFGIRPEINEELFNLLSDKLERLK